MLMDQAPLETFFSQIFKGGQAQALGRSVVNKSLFYFILSNVCFFFLVVSIGDRNID